MKKAHIVKHFIKGCTLAQIWYRKPYQFYYSAKFSLKNTLSQTKAGISHLNLKIQAKQHFSLQPLEELQEEACIRMYQDYD